MGELWTHLLQFHQQDVEVTGEGLLMQFLGCLSVTNL